MPIVKPYRSVPEPPGQFKNAEFGIPPDLGGWVGYYDVPQYGGGGIGGGQPTKVIAADIDNPLYAFNGMGWGGKVRE
jgi:hypothetical protein